MSDATLIIGGGFAGLATAVDLAAAGRRVLLLERRAFLGGRAYSYTDRVTGDTVDNGQHLMMGCYHQTLDFLARIGSTDKLKLQASPRVDFMHPHEGSASFQCPALPAPLHLLAGLARLQTIGWRDRLRALLVGIEMRSLNGNRARLADITVGQWLCEMGQTDRMQERFWDLVALATLNEHPETASADMFAEVIERAFMRTRRDSAMLISRVGLSDLYTHDARAYIEARGGHVQMNTTVQRIEIDGARAHGVTLANGEFLPAATMVSAVPYFALKTMLPDDIIQADTQLRHIAGFRSAPIVSINLWYEQPVMEQEFAGLLESRIEWIFNKNAIAGVPQTGRQHLALVISGAHAAAKLTKEQLTALAITEMERFFPAARRQKPLHAVVIREHDATISHTPGTARQRPSQKTSIAGFYLAGDWTATGLPATIEGAVWSGQECARLILAKG
ncbi:MAG: hydroxysqualene dehydroxylase HpnE [Blastocatellia bacterium]